LGGSGNDTLSGYAGTNVLDGGAGTDTVSYSWATAGVTVDMGLTTSQNTGVSFDQLLNVENLTGSAYNDTLKGNALNNIIAGGIGTNVIDGSTGTDTVSYSWAITGVTVDMSLTTSQSTGVSSDRFLNVENLTGSNYSDTLKGNALANVIDGGVNNDTLYGGASNDTLYGGAGNDTLYSDAGSDILNGGAGVDTFVFLKASAFTGTDTIQDFLVSDGDVLNISDILDFYTITDLNIADFVKLTVSGVNSVMTVDQDGAGSAFTFQNIATLTGGATLSITDLFDTNHLVA
jgi:Ca2+-binding RTX toxin-like protein